MRMGLLRNAIGAALTAALLAWSPAAKAETVTVGLVGAVSSTHWPVYIGIKKGEAGLKAVVDETLRDLEKSGEAQKIFIKWYGPATASGFQSRDFKFDTDKIVE